MTYYELVLGAQGDENKNRTQLQIGNLPQP